MDNSTLALNGFPRKYRLITANDYRKVFSKAQKVSTPEFLFLYSTNEKADSRLGLAIAKKQFPHAVDRNRIKRLVRESFRETRPAIESTDIVVLGRSKLLKMNNNQIRKQLDSLWSKLILKKQTSNITSSSKG